MKRQTCRFRLGSRCGSAAGPIRRIGASALLLFGAALANVVALDFAPLGPVPLSMGGAGVASAPGPYAAYYNPALLARPSHRTELAVAGGGAFEDAGLLAPLDTLADLGFADTFDLFAEAAQTGILPASLESDVNSVLNAVRDLSEGGAAEVTPCASIALQAGRLGLGLYAFADVTGRAVVDPARTEWIVRAGDRYLGYRPADGALYETDRADYEAHSLQYAVDEGLSYLAVRGVGWIEIPVAYGYPWETRAGTLQMGGAVKALSARTVAAKVSLDEEAEDWDQTLEESERESMTFGFDAGLLFRPAFLDSLAVGCVGRNLNRPGFETAEGPDLRLDPQVRAGVAWDAWKRRLTLALDADVTRNETLLTGWKHQWVGGGVNLHPASWFSLRAGVMKNVAESGQDPVLTGGLGLGLKWLQIDLSAQVSTGSTEFEDARVPSYAAAQLALISKWK